MDDELWKIDDNSISSSSSSSSSSDNGDSDEPSVDHHQISSTMNKRRGLITSIRKSRLSYEEVLQIARAANVEGDVILDMKIRWNWTFKMIYRLLIYRKLIEHFYDTLDSLEGINSKQRQTLIKLELLEVEWNIMQVLHHVLESFYVATKALSGHRYPTLPLAYAVIYSLPHYLNNRSALEYCNSTLPYPVW